MRERRRNYVQRIIKDILETDGSAEIVARSFAIGTFVALLPTFGFGFMAAVGLVLVVPVLHKPSVLGAFVVWNPLVQIPLYSLSIWIGTLLFSGLPVVSVDVVFLDHIYNFTRRVFIGNIIVTTTLTIVSYLTIFTLIRRAKGKPLLPPKVHQNLHSRQ